MVYIFYYIIWYKTKDTQLFQYTNNIYYPANLQELGLIDAYNWHLVREDSFGVGWRKWRPGGPRAQYGVLQGQGGRYCSITRGPYRTPSSAARAPSGVLARV